MNRSVDLKKSNTARKDHLPPLNPSYWAPAETLFDSPDRVQICTVVRFGLQGWHRGTLLFFQPPELA